MTTLVMKYHEARLVDPIDKPTLIFALAAFGGVTMYGLSAAGMILHHFITSVL